VETELYSKLSTTAGVTALVSTRIYPGLAPPSASASTPFSFVVYTRIDTDPVNNATPGNSGSEWSHFQLDVYASSYALGRSVADAVRAAIIGWRNTTTSTPRIDSCLLVGERDKTEPPDTPDGSPIHRVIQEYSIWSST
jgi:hypothetical protein